MKLKHLLLTSLVALSSVAFADSDNTIKLSDPDVSLKCGTYQITPNSKKQDIIKHCKVIDYQTKGIFRRHDVIKLLLSDGGYLQCKVMNEKLHTCKLVD